MTWERRNQLFRKIRIKSALGVHFMAAGSGFDAKPTNSFSSIRSKAHYPRCASRSFQAYQRLRFPSVNKTGRLWHDLIFRRHVISGVWPRRGRHGQTTAPRELRLGPTVPSAYLN